MATATRSARQHSCISMFRSALFGVTCIALLSGCPSNFPIIIVTGPGSGFVPGLASPIAPGLNIDIQQVTVPADNRVEVRFAATDNQGNRIPLAELVDVRFILAYLNAPTDGSTMRYTSYTTTIEDPDRVPGSGDEATQATYDTARLGGVTENNDGSYTYKFAAVLPAGFSRTSTHQLGGQVRRDAIIDGKAYKANPLFVFRFDGRAVTHTREIVSTASCNDCHTRLSEHGDIRRQVQLCILCHNHQSTDANTGNSVDFAEMIHKIHHGENLPSVQDGEPYQLVGFGGTVFDYSTVVFPQDVRNCTVCHNDAPHADFFKTQPTLQGCVSCHDRTWFGDPDMTPMGFTNHIGGMHTDNRLCSLCHTPDAPGASPVSFAHLLPTESPAAPGLFLDITGVNVAKGGAGNTVSIDFVAVDKNGAPYTNPASFNSVAATIAWPAPEYEQNVREVIATAAGGPSARLTNNGGGNYTYTFGRVFDDEPGMSYGVGMEGRVSFAFRGSNFNQGTSSNGVTFFTMDGSAPTPRRTIISAESCNDCHKEIRFHGEQRFGVDYCVMCHNVNATDVARRPMDAMPPETINFKDMIHAIHTGEDLTTDYTVYGFGNVAHDFTHVRFPGDRRECTICHAPGTFGVPLPAEALSTMVAFDGEVVRDVLPERASCTSCHDNVFANVHAIINTDVVGRVESCVVCHGSNANFSVMNVHQIQP